MLRATTNITSSAPPITHKEFREALLSIWNQDGPARSFRRPLGLAVSGGVDSMALAVLCSEWSRYNTPRPELTAFIVDHKLRKGSADEARMVAEWLEHKLQIPSVVLPMLWPERTDPRTLRNFESQARRLRYQALGIACREASIRSLLLAHHEDDQAETVLVRMVRSGIGLGLTGIAPMNDIPECFGLYGVHQSGGSHLNQPDNDDHASTMQHGRNKGPYVGLENGGIKIMRPLLNFSKERLIATCLERDVPWVEDETNKDPRLTIRNAVRHVFSNHRLPSALSKQRLLALSSTEIKRMKKYSARVELLFNRCKLKLDTRSGTLAVEFPPGSLACEEGLKQSISNKSEEIPDTESSILSEEKYTSEEAHLIAYMLIRRLVEIVTPQEKVSLYVVRNAPLHSLFPSLAPLQKTGRTQRDQSKFALARVFFEREVIYPETSEQETPNSSGKPRNAKDAKPQTIWHLSRTGYVRAREDELLKVIIPIPPYSGFLDGIRRQNPQLFDGRFWIRVPNGTPFPLVVRPFCQTDLKPFLASLTRRNSRRFLERLRMAAPGAVRWTLPAIAMAEPDDDGEKLATPLGRVIALPTLNVRADQLGETERWTEKVRWHVRFRKVDLGQHDEADVVVGASSDPKEPGF